MNSDLKHLAEIGSNKSRVIIGLMSGTSFDGLDIALCKFTGNGRNTMVEVLHFTTLAFDNAFKEKLKAVFAKAIVDQKKLTLLNATIGICFGKLVLKQLAAWNFDADKVDLIASHGQTVYHAPGSAHGMASEPNATLQIGDGDHLAFGTGIITISDFRQKHVAAGGEGAPLAVYGDYILFSDASEERIMLNIGGISNFTFLPASGKAEQVFCTDIGPGNTLMDQYVQKHFPDKYYDKDALIASSGTVNEDLLKALSVHPFFSEGFPRTTGPELFNLNFVESAVAKTGLILPQKDIMATLCHFSAKIITDALGKFTNGKTKPVVYLSGGGIHNPMLMQIIKMKLSELTFKSTAELGIHPDAKEAVLFAILANECVAGDPINFGARTDMPSVAMGKISLPN